METTTGLRGWVREDFGIDLVALEPVGRGADDTAALWRGVAGDGTAYAVKLSGHGTPGGLAVTAHLARLGVAGVVAPVRSVVGGRAWTDRVGLRLSVVPWVPGERALTVSMTAAQWAAYGALLAAVHTAGVPDEVACALPREEHTHGHLRTALEALEAAVGLPADDLARAVAAEWRAASDRVSSLLGHAHRLGPQLRARRSPAVICHGDAHLGNLLVGDGGVWLVDWDDALLAPPERDLMFVAGGVLSFAPVTEQQQPWFFDGYGAAEPDSARMAYYRCTRALEDVVDWAAQALDVTRPEGDRVEALSIAPWGPLADRPGEPGACGDLTRPPHRQRRP